MVIQRFFVNPFQEACYVVSQAQGMKAGECLIIDCGAYYPEEEAAISKYIETSGLRPIAHLLTHAHLDHLFGARFVFETWGLRPIVDDADESLFSRYPQVSAIILGTKNDANLAATKLISFHFVPW